MLLLSHSGWAYSFQSGGICYNITSSTAPCTVEVTSGGSYSGSVSIPSTVAYNGITYSVTSIGHAAFYGCSGLTSVTIPNSVTRIVQSAFYGCSGLTALYFNADSCVTMQYNNNSVFSDCSNLRNLNIENNVRYLPTYAFAGCSSLDSVTIGSGVASIGQYVFRGCSGLTSVTIPNSVTSIGGWAFAGCSGLTTINFNADSCVFAWIPFEGCINVTSLTIGNNVKVVPSTVFSGLVGLTNLTMGDSIRTIGREAFYGCSHLPSVTIPDMVTTLDMAAFRSCSELYSVSIGKRVGIIRPLTFANCAWLTNVSVGEGVTMIDQEAFYNSLRVSTLTMKPVAPPLIYSQSLSTLSDTVDIYVPCNAISAYRNAPHWGRFVNYHGDFVNDISCRSNNEAWGRVNIIERPSCTNGGMAQIQALPNNGCRFLRWSDGNTQSLRTLTVSEDTILTAFFASNQDIDEAENEDFRVITHGERIVIEGAAGERVFVSDVLGRIVYNAIVNEKADIAVRHHGVFLVKVGNRPAQKVVVAR